MKRYKTLLRLALLFIVVGASVWGCRDVTPARPLNENLGTADEPLLPTQMTRYYSGLEPGGGQDAEWHPFRPFEPEAEEEAAAAGESDDESGGLEAEIRDLISEYNELLAERAVEDLLEYHVEEQQEAVEAFYELGFASIDKLGELQAALEEKLPDQKDRIATMFGPALSQANSGLTVESLTVVSEEEVTGRLVGGEPITGCRFLLLDEDWYIELQGLPDAATLTTMGQAIAATYDSRLQAIREGQVPADQMLTQMEVMFQAMLPAGESGAEDAAGTTGDAGGAGG